MSALLLRDYLLPFTATASSSAAGFPATAVLTPGVQRGWRSSAAGGQWLQIDLGTTATVAAVALQAIGVVGGGIAVLADTSNPPVTARGSLSAGPDKNGRIKGSLAFTPAVVRYIRFNFSSSLAPYSVGSAFAFGTAAPLPCDPLYGGSGITMLDPQVRNELPNGQVEVYNAGAPAVELDLGFAAKETDDVELLRRAARLLPCWFDFGLADRGRQWPVRHIDAETQRRMDGYNRESVNIRLREIT